MEAEGIVAISTAFFTCTVGLWGFVFIIQKPPKWEVEKDKLLVRIKPEKNNTVHMYLNDFLNLDRSHSADNSLTRKNSDVFSLFYTKKLLFNLIFSFSTVFLISTLIMYVARIIEVISHEIPFSQILNTGSNVDTFVLMCIAFYLLLIPSLVLGFFCMRHIESSLETLKHRREKL